VFRSEPTENRAEVVSEQRLTVHFRDRQELSVSDLALVRHRALVAYVDHAGRPPGETADGTPIVSFETWSERFRDLPSIVTALDPATRRAIAERILAAGGACATLERAGGPIAASVAFGSGCIVVGEGPLSINSTTNFGRHVILMTPASIGHDCRIGDFVTIFPSAVISGHVAIEDDVVLEVGSVIVNGRADRPLVVGRGARIAVGAVVTKSVPSGARVVGNPGRIIRLP
jgi:UDP-3-O-[3-hydroxymyristoyl] glucosamine N-acyltransferase